MSKRTIKIFFSSDSEQPFVLTSDAKLVDYIFNNIIRGNPPVFELEKDKYYINPSGVEVAVIEEVKEDE